jgi:subtilisin family serine protease
MQPDHGIRLAYHIQGNPHGAPEPATEPHYQAGETAHTDGRLTTVAVVDSGITRHPWLDGHYPARSLHTDLAQWDLSKPQFPFLAAHGVFVAGIVHKYAPQATILPRRVIDLDGGSNDDVVATAILDLVADDPDVLNLSLAPAHHDHEGGTCPPAPSTARAIDILQETCGTIVVISAGYADEPWPQKHLAPRGERTMFVGAFGVDNKPAEWSDTQDVTFWAPGEHVVSFFVHASTTNGRGTAMHFDGWAKWSGTSFAAPALAGAVATAVSRRPQPGDKHHRRLAGLEDVLRDGLNAPVF